MLQVGPRDKQRLDQVMGANEIGRICALMDEQSTPGINDAAALIIWRLVDPDHADPARALGPSAG